MSDKGKELRDKWKALGLKARQIHEAMEFGSIDTVRQLGKIRMSQQMLDEIERAMERARRKALVRLNAAG